MSDLAIVIPAYKSDFLYQTLDSFAQQSNKNFTLYVGDDYSPFDLESIVRRFQDKMEIKYHRFENNLGGKDLVSHWSRCVDLVEEEDWIWLFSDDDLVGTNCVEAFYHLKDKDSFDVFHFDINIIDSYNNVIRDCPNFPEIISSPIFFEKLFRRQITARMPEFIFRRKALLEKGFVNFDMAWRTDTATIMSLGNHLGIRTINETGTKVLWRASDQNISSLLPLMERKNLVNICFFNWADEFFKNNGLKCPFSKFRMIKTIVFELEFRGAVGFFKDGINAVRELTFLSVPNKLLFICFMFYRLIYRLHE